MLMITLSLPSQKRIFKRSWMFLQKHIKQLASVSPSTTHTSSINQCLGRIQLLPLSKLMEKPLPIWNTLPTWVPSHLSLRADIDADFQHCLQSTSLAFWWMPCMVFDDHDICTDTKILVYKPVILPTLLYSLGTWTMHRYHLKILERHHQQCLRKILCISWEDRCTNISVLKVAKCTSIEAMLICYQLHWPGHVLRMPYYPLLKQVLLPS